MNAAKYNSIVPENISRLIQASGFKQGTVAERAGLSKQQLCDMINGRKIIKPCDVMAIAKALGVNAGELFSENARKGVERA